MLARKLDHPAVSAIEFSVAGGNALVSLEMHAEHVTRRTGVRVAIYGFNTGAGLPPPTNHRDIPYLWQAGFFAMDQERLRARVRSAKLLIGRVEETVASCEREETPPIGFISFDLDCCSSTAAALKIFLAGHAHPLPRVICDVDDMTGDLDWACNDFTGELLAINEISAAHANIKLAPARGFGHHLPRSWHEQMFVAHLFRHPDYNRPTSVELSQLHLGA